MVFLILLFFLVFTSPVFAAPSLQITVAPSTLNTGITFPVTFIIQNSNPNISYHYKFFGGIGDSNTQIQTTTSLSYTSEWDNFSIVTVDIGGSAVINAYAYISSDKPSGSYNLSVRIAQADDHSKIYTSNSYLINNVINNTPTSVPTLTPTPDSAVTNPTSGITLTEFMPYSSIEWIEIYNNNDYPVKLVGWKIGHNTSTTKNFDLTINSKSYGTFDFSNFLNNDGDKIILYDNNNNNRGERSYESNKYTLDRSWSLVNNSWCQADLTKGNSNTTSCYSAPTSTPTPTFTPTPTKSLSPTPTPDQGKYTPDESATASAIIDPINITSPSITPTTNPTPTNSVSFTETNSSKPQKRYLPLIFIISGGCLLVSPLAINKIKKQK